METSLFSYALAFLLLNTLTLSSSTAFFNFTTDQHALLAFKKTITSDPHGVLSTNWSINTSICQWIGVSCSSKHHRVTALNVSGFHLEGTIAPHLGNLTFLRSLDLSNNSFTGFIPFELSNLRRLKDINVGFNHLTGEVSSWFGTLSQLQHMYLNSNNFSGRIPPSLFNISRLQTLDIGSNFLDGNVPEEIGLFPSLEILNLEGNQFTGTIPDGIFNISSLIEIYLNDNILSGKLTNGICSNTPKLKKLNLSKNQLYGIIPANLYKCRELEDLGLAINRFNGNVPSEIGNLTMLKYLSIFSNAIEGNIPKQIGNLTFMTYLILESNHLTGELPQELANLAFLQHFYAGNNSLSGPIPPSMFNISTLKYLELSFNQFSGGLPLNSLDFSIFNLEALSLQANRLSGPIPSSITNASKLTLLDLELNSFSGFMPNFGNLRLLETLRIWGNNLTGGGSPTQELEFFSSLTDCRYLERLEVSENPLNGILPTSIGNLSTSLLYFSVDQNDVYGVIPSEIGNLSSLVDIYLYENHLTGVIPAAIGKLKQLQRLYLGDNQLQEYIPSELCQMSNLGVLDLSDNMLTHQIPSCLGELKHLREINLGLNKLNSTIPSNVWNLRDILTLNLSSNYLSGQLSSQIGNLQAINQIDLSSNRFSGDIPSSIGSCQSLEILSLSNNKFRGSIPQSLGNARGLTKIDLSTNNLSGLIPKSLEDLKFLQYFNVSYNKLEGEIPNEGCFVNFTAQSFVHNYALCGATRFQVPPCSENHGGPKSKSVVQVMKYVLPSLISAIILVMVTFMLIKRRKQKKEPLSNDIFLGIEWRRISYTELERGAGSFSETNLLGRGSFGSVFKGTLSDGLIVAIKVFNLQLEGAFRSFETESEILSTVRHRNLVRVIGCCSNTEFKALILAYMPNGSLEKWLCSDEHYLDLMQRLKIAIDVALAMEYLHHGHTFPVVHCDIKPSNVLLDQDMTARIGDFGISKLFDQGEEMIQTKTLATIGYAAPEYGMDGKVSTNGDVFSYGILLLEIFTGKKPTDDMFSEEMSLKEWVTEALQNNAIMEVLAPSLLSRDDQHFFAKQQCVLSIFEVAMKCLVFSPEERINMIEAGAVLQKIKARVVADTLGVETM